MATIDLRGIEVWAHHGVLPEEREHGQPFRIDVRLELDIAAAARSDDLGATVDYRDVAVAVRDAATGGPYQLIETVAARVADACLAQPLVTAAEVTVHKPEVELAVPTAGVSVTLRRERVT